MPDWLVQVEAVSEGAHRNAAREPFTIYYSSIHCC